MVWMEVVCSLLKEEALVNLIQWVATLPMAGEVRTG